MTLEIDSASTMQVPLPQETCNEQENLVRLYKHDEKDGSWIEKATGSFSTDTCEVGDKFRLLLAPPESEPIEIDIIKELEYKRSNANIICWEDGDGNWALSFNKIESCAEFSGKIAKFQYNAMGTLWLTEVQLAGNDAAPDEWHFPIPEYGNLELINQCLDQAMQNFALKRRTAIELEKNETLTKLFIIFEKSKDLEDENNSKLLVQIFRKIVLLNDENLMDRLLQEQNVFNFISILEQDPVFASRNPELSKQLECKSSFKQVVPVENPELLARIHTIFRARFIRDFVIKELMSEETCSVFNWLISHYQESLFEMLQKDTQFGHDLVQLFETDNLNTRNQLISFLIEYYEMSKSTTNVGLHVHLDHFQVLSFVESSFRTEGVNQNGVIELLAYLTEKAAASIRKFVLKHPDSLGESLIKLIIKNFHSATSISNLYHLHQIIKLLCEPQLSLEKDESIEEFLNFFYPNSASDLFQPLSCPKDVQIETLYLLLELLCSFIKHHKFRSKYLLIGSSILTSLHSFFSYKEKHMNLAALRVFRTVLGCNDSFYNRFLIKHCCFRFILELLAKQKHKDNLLVNSSFEIFHFIYSKSGKLVTDHLESNFPELIKEICHWSPIFSTIVCFPQDQKQQVHGTATSSTNENSAGSMADIQKEEDYFSKQDEENSSLTEEASLSSDQADSDESLPSPKLVDYDDNEDEDDFLSRLESPLKKQKQK